jgi:CubicO group peptidase (beta-lactamase class C family)
MQLAHPVSRYLPKFRNMKVSMERRSLVRGDLFQTLVPAEREITLHDLLRHTSGLVYGCRDCSLVHQAYIDLAVSDCSQVNVDMMDKLAALPLAYHPGSTFEYGVSTDVLGHVIELVSDMSLDMFMQEKLCKPLGLADTSFHVKDGDLHRLAMPGPDYSNASDTSAVSQNTSRPIAGGGSLFSTAPDVFRFMQMLLNNGALDGVRLLAPKTVVLMTCNHLPPHTRYGPYTSRLEMAAPSPDKGQGFGLGFTVRLEAGRNPLPGSIGDYSWLNISGIYVWADPREKLVGVLMSHVPETTMQHGAMTRMLAYQALVESSS